MVQAAFREGKRVDECACKTAVLIPKGNRDLCGIGLVEVIWKTAAGILSCCLTPAVHFHDNLQGLHTIRGTGTAYLESKMLQPLMDMREEVLYGIFLYLHKAYDTLDHNLCFEILTAYGVVHRALHLLCYYWSILTMVVRDGGYFGIPFKGYHRLTQGRQLSTTIFNGFIDAVLRHWIDMVALAEKALDPEVADTEGFGRDVQHLAA